MQSGLRELPATLDALSIVFLPVLAQSVFEIASFSSQASPSQVLPLVVVVAGSVADPRGVILSMFFLLTLRGLQGHCIFSTNTFI